jgi:MinD superfamily P-loop ATPase
MATPSTRRESVARSAIYAVNLTKQRESANPAIRAIASSMEPVNVQLKIVDAPLGTETPVFNALRDGTSILKVYANQSAINVLVGTAMATA